MVILPLISVRDQNLDDVNVYIKPPPALLPKNKEKVR